MEAKTNIAEILKDKPQGTKLYDLLYNVDVELDTISTTDDVLMVYRSFFLQNQCEIGLSSPGRKAMCWLVKITCILSLKSLKMMPTQDLKASIIFGKNVTKKIIVKKKPKCLLLYLRKPTIMKLSLISKPLRKKLGGKFNRETLEVEKPHPEFKDGDIITITPQIGNNLIFIFRAKDVEKYYCHAYLDGNIAIVNDDSYCQKYFCTARPSTEEEQKQLFDALAKKGKAWDAEKKAIVDLKPKCEFKPFDRCIWKIRNCEGSIWQASFVSYVDEYGATPMGMSIDEDLVNLIILPYNDQTKLLVGTTDEWKGGEQ